MAKVELFLSNESRLVPVLAAQTDQDECRIVAVTQQQFDKARVHVRGTAGFGKTIFAMWAAQAFAEQSDQARNDSPR